MVTPKHGNLPDNWRRSYHDELLYDEEIEESAFKNVVLLLDDEKENFLYKEEDFEEEDVEF